MIKTNDRLGRELEQLLSGAAIAEQAPGPERDQHQKNWDARQAKLDAEAAAEAK